jgi:hypothetical protein
MKINFSEFFAPLLTGAIGEVSRQADVLKSQALDYVTNAAQNVLAYNDNEYRASERKRITYEGNMKILQKPLEQLYTAAGRPGFMDYDKVYALLSNDPLRAAFLKQVQDEDPTIPGNAKRILDRIQVTGEQNFKNKNEVIKALIDPRYKPIPKARAVRMPFGLGEKEVMRAQEQIIESTFAGSPELLRGQMYKGLGVKPEISGIMKPDAIMPFNDSQFTSVLKNAYKAIAPKYFKSIGNTKFQGFQEDPRTGDLIISYQGIADNEKEKDGTFTRSRVRDAIRKDFLSSVIPQIMQTRETEEGTVYEISKTYAAKLNTMFDLFGVDDALKEAGLPGGKYIPRLGEAEEGTATSRVRLDPVHLELMGIETGVTDKGATDDKGTTAVKKEKEKPVIKYTSGFENRKKQFNESIPSKFKNFIVETLGGYDAEPFTEEEKANIPIKKIVDFIQENYGTGSVGPSGKAAYPKLTQEELNTIIDIMIYRHGAPDTLKNRELAKEQILNPKDKSINLIRPRIIETEKEDKVEPGQVTQAGIVDSPVGKITYYKGLRTQAEIDKVVSDLKKEIDKIQRDTRKKAAKNIQQDPKSMERESQLQRDLEYYSKLESTYSSHYYGKLEKNK